MSAVVTAVLECGHLAAVPATVVLPDVAECPLSGYEREIASVGDEEW